MKILTYILSTLVLTAVYAPAHALTNGKWNATVSCGPREDVTPVRPAFKADLPQLTISKQQFSLPRTYKEPKNTVTEEWRGQVSAGNLVISAKSQRDNGNVWAYELKAPNTSGGVIQLQGAMLDENGKQIRSCSMNLALVEAEATPAPATVVTAPSKQSSPVVVPAPAKPVAVVVTPQTAPATPPAAVKPAPTPPPLSAATAVSKPETVGKASFDCTKASSSQEKAICASPALSALDVKLAEVYKAALASTTDAATLKANQIVWIKESRGCKDDATCLERLYNTRIAELTPAPQPAATPLKPEVPVAAVEAPATVPSADRDGVQGALPKVIEDLVAVSKDAELFDMYVSRNSIVRNGSSVSFENILDLQGEKLKSIKSQFGAASQRNKMEVDCDRRRIRTLEFTMYSDQMGGGEIKYSTTPKASPDLESFKWRELTKNTPDFSSYELVCFNGRSSSSATVKIEPEAFWESPYVKMGAGAVAALTALAIAFWLTKKLIFGVKKGAEVVAKKGAQVTQQVADKTSQAVEVAAEKAATAKLQIAEKAVDMAARASSATQTAAGVIKDAASNPEVQSGIKKAIATAKARAILFWSLYVDWFRKSPWLTGFMTLIVIGVLFGGSEGGGRSDGNERTPDGLTKGQWYARCEKYESAKQECAVAANISRCMETKAGTAAYVMGGAYCDGATPMFHLMGVK